MRATGGSSPLARGLRPSSGLVYRPIGIIPARAGFTAAVRLPARRSQDHPRSRGVYAGIDLGAVNPDGSSPLARGLREMVSSSASSLRIIPARAGFTGCTTGRPTARRDHPRSRGVYPAQVVRASSPFGLSPLARGLRCAARTSRWRPRIIPARAGFTRMILSFSLPLRDHPRSRGVYSGPGASRS